MWGHETSELASKGATEHHWAKGKGEDWGDAKVAHLDVLKANHKTFFVSRSLFSFQSGPELKCFIQKISTKKEVSFFYEVYVIPEDWLVAG